MKSEKIQQVKEHFQNTLGQKFNQLKFDADVLSGKEIDEENLNEYKTDEENPRFCFTARFQNGEYVAIGSNGHVIKSKNLDDLHRKLAQVFKLHALKKGKEPFCRISHGEKVQNKEAISESFARTFINAGITIAGDVPKSPAFWQALKQDYLAKKGHTQTTWQRLTRFVPPEYIQPVFKTKAPSVPKRQIPFALWQTQKQCA